MQHAIHIRLTYAAQTWGSWSDAEGIFQRHDFFMFLFWLQNEQNKSGLCLRRKKTPPTFQIPSSFIYFLHQYQNKTDWMLIVAVPLMTVCLNIWELKSRQEFAGGGREWRKGTLRFPAGKMHLFKNRTTGPMQMISLHLEAHSLAGIPWGLYWRQKRSWHFFFFLNRFAWGICT